MVSAKNTDRMREFNMLEGRLSGYRNRSSSDSAIADYIELYIQMQLDCSQY